LLSLFLYFPLYIRLSSVRRLSLKAAAKVTLFLLLPNPFESFLKKFFLTASLWLSLLF